MLPVLSLLETRVLGVLTLEELDEPRVATEVAEAEVVDDDDVPFGEAPD